MSELSEFRQSKDEFCAGSHNSPLTHDQTHDFKGLRYFDDNPDLRFVVDPETFESQEVVEMQTSTGDVAQYIRWGRISFEVGSQKAQLTLMKEEDGGGFASLSPTLPAVKRPMMQGAISRSRSFRTASS